MGQYSSLEFAALSKFDEWQLFIDQEEVDTQHINRSSLTDSSTLFMPLVTDLTGQVA